MTRNKVIIHLDHTEESELLRKAMFRTKIPFSIVYEQSMSGSGWRLPAIEGPMGIVYGWSNIKAYFDLPVD